jgi:hypothetical protein
VELQLVAEAQATSVPAAVQIMGILSNAAYGDLAGFPYYVKRIANSTGSLFRSQDRYLPNGSTDIVNGGYWALTNGSLAPSGAATVAALRLLAVTANADISTSGYYAPNDGGGNTFFGVTGASPGTYVDNGGSIIVPTGGNGSAAWLQLDKTKYNVVQFGADPTGSIQSLTFIQNCVNAATVNSIKNYGGQTQNLVYFPGGTYLLNNPIQLYSAVGVRFEGAGRFSTTLYNPSGTGLWNTNGCAWCYFAHMQWVGNNAGEVLFNLDWQGTPSTISVQGNIFEDLYLTFAGQGIQQGISGFSLSPGAQADTTSIRSCFFNQFTVAGYSVNNFNALGNSVTDACNFNYCAIGIWVQEGSIPVISDANFEHNTTADIQIDSSASDSYLISGCRTESVNFVVAKRGNLHISGCTQHTGGSALIFASIGYHPCLITSCCSDSGQILSINGNMPFTLMNCEFGNANFTGGTIHITYGYLTNCLIGGLADQGTGIFYGPWYFFQCNNGGTAVEYLPQTPDAVGALTSNYSLGNNTTPQPIFVTTLAPTGKTGLSVGKYFFESLIQITNMSATSGNALINVLGGGSATMANALFMVDGVDASSPSTPQTWGGSAISGANATGAAAVIATTGTAMVVRLRGTFEITVAGTIQPQIQLANASAAVVTAGSYIRFSPLSIGSIITNYGNWT